MAEASQEVINRRQLLRGDIRGTRLPIRPPWAISESLFVTACDRCDKCLDACEINILIRGSGGFPEINFQNAGCSFCGDCMQACPTGALHAEYPAPSIAWNLTVQINSNCLSLNGIVCRACGDACESDAIQFQLQTGGRANPELNSEQCNGCGECLAVCPIHCIEIQPNTSASHIKPEDNEVRI